MHAPTLFIALSGITFVAALLMLREWKGRRQAAPELLWWCAGFFCVSVSSTLSPLRVYGLDDLAYGLANALALLGYACNWLGARSFANRSMPIAVLLVGPAWMLAWTATPLLASSEARIVATGTGIGILSFATAHALYPLRASLRAAREITMVFVAHGLFYFSRAAMALAATTPIDARRMTGAIFTIVMFEAVLAAVLAAALFLSMTRERSLDALRAMSETDYLTGIDNRRAFTAKSEALLAACRKDGREASVLVFDLDHFKTINDLHGHAAGDEILRSFSRIVEEHLRVGDTFGRLGGEEFAAVLRGQDLTSAMRTAEAIRRRFRDRHAEIDGRPLGATVSIGAAGGQGDAGHLETQISHADRALYRAKHRGRDRVESDADWPAEEIAGLVEAS